MKVTTFQTVAEKLANTLGRERGVRVTFGGTGAWMRPGHIHLPALPAGTVMSPFEADLMRGFLDHEIGHVRRSDFSVIDAAAKDFGAKPSLRTLHNWTEDVWEENLTIKEYTDRFLNTTHSFMDEQAAKEITAAREAGEPVTFADLAMRLTYREIWKRRGLDRDVGSDLTLEDLGLGAVNELLAKEFDLLRSTKDNLRLTEKIHALLEEAVEEFEPPPPEGGEGDEGDGKPGEGKPGEGKPGDGEPGDGEPGDGEPGDGEPGDGEDKPGDSGGTGRAKKPTEAGSLDDNDGKPEHQKLLEKVLQRIVDKNGKDEGRKKKVPRLVANEEPADPDNTGEYIEMEWSGDDYRPPAGTEHDRIFVPSGENLSRYRTERAKMAAPISSIKKALTIYLRSQQMKAWTRGLEDGRLDEEALGNFCATGDRRVFKQRRMRTFPNTAFSLILDLSSSMNAPLVRLTATAFIEALAQLPRIKTMAAGFTTNRHKYAPTPGCGRTEGMDLLLFKDFSEPYRTAMPRLGAIGTSGCTPLGEGYGYGFEALVSRPEMRKVLLIVTDGAPCYDWGSGARGGAGHNDFALIKHVHQKCHTFGVETLGIAIKSDGLEGYVDKNKRIDTPHELTRAVLEITKRVVVP